jgi:hypothetical protein
MSGSIKFIVLGLMISTIVMLLMYPTLIEDYINPDQVKVSSTIKNEFKTLKEKLSFRTKMIIVSCFIVALGVLLLIIRSDSKQFQAKNKNSYQAHIKPTCSNGTYSKEEYEKETQETTNKELLKLQNNPKYQQMLRERGVDKANWNWQTAEKEKSNVHRDGKETSDEDEDLSHV